MSNYYLSFSEVIPRLTKPEEAWLAHQLETIYVFGDREFEQESIPLDLDRTAADWHGCRNSRDLPGLDEYDRATGFSFEFQGNRRARQGWGRHLWLFSEEFGELDRVGHLVQKFLRRFRPSDCWWLTYATTCSRPHAGSFGGGAMFVTAQRVKWTNADQFVEREHKAFERRRGKSLKKPKRGGHS